MSHQLLIVADRGGNVAPVIILVVLVVGLLSLPLMPLFHYSHNQRLRHFGGRAYGFLGVVSKIIGLILIPVSLLAVAVAGVVRYRGTGLSQTLIAFVLGCAIWLSAPLVFFALGRFQGWFSRRLAPEIWDKKTRTALNRGRAKLRRSGNAT